MNRVFTILVALMVIVALLVLTVVCVCKNKKAQPSGRAASDSVVVQGDPMGAKAPVGRTAV